MKIFIFANSYGEVRTYNADTYEDAYKLLKNDVEKKLYDWKLIST